jgi:hypothetical protein
LLDEMIGSPAASGYAFRWYLQIWGWLYFAAFLVLVFSWWREDRGEEERLRNECTSD